jgi:predicted ATPase
MGGTLSSALRASWLPRITNGWFFRAESFFSVERYLDAMGSGADFLSHSHGEGFLRFFEERCQRQGIYIFDEPESALSPNRQMEFLKLMRRMEESSHCQVIMATHSPILMAYPGASLLGLAI